MILFWRARRDPLLRLTPCLWYALHIIQNVKGVPGVNPYLVQAIGFVGVALSESIAIASILVSIWRFGWNNLAEETS